MLLSSLPSFLSNEMERKALTQNPQWKEEHSYGAGLLSALSAY